MALKSEIAPKGIEFKPTEFRLGDKYSTLLTIVSYPKNISPGYLADIINIPGVKVAIKHIPIPFDVLRKMLNKEIADLKVRYQNENDKTTQYASYWYIKHNIRRFLCSRTLAPLTVYRKIRYFNRENSKTF